MPFIDTIPAEAADGEVLAMYQRQRGKNESVPEYAQVFCYRPRLMQAWAAMQTELKTHMDNKTYYLVSMIASVEVYASSCAMVFAQKLLVEYYSSQEITAIIDDTPDTPLSLAEQAIVHLTRKVVRDASAVNQQDIDLLRVEGVADPVVFDVIAAAAARCFFAKIPDALGVQPDTSMRDLGGQLLAILTVGRPI